MGGFRGIFKETKKMEGYQ